MNESSYSQIVYFEREGRENLAAVLRVLKKALKKREDLRSLKLVIFTAMGEGPALAYTQLSEFDLRIIAVTFPLDFSFKRGDDIFFPKIPSKVQKFFAGVDVKVVPPAPLPFDSIGGMQLHSEQMKIIKDTISMFGGGFSLCIQAVLRACDTGEVEAGERVIAMGGDCAAIIAASTTAKFLTSEGLSVQEIFCKARNLTIARKKAVSSSQPAQQVLTGSDTAIEGKTLPAKSE